MDENKLKEPEHKISEGNLAAKHLELFRKKYYEEQRIKDERTFCCFLDQKCKRILALIYISLIGFFSLVSYDLPGSLESQIEKTYSVHPYEFEYLYSLTCFPNIILAYFDGILIDRVLGIKLASYLMAAIVLLGQIVFTLGGFVRQFWVLLLGRFIYGLGCDSLLVICNYYSVLWFNGKGLNFVFGVVMSSARLGTSFVFLIASPFYNLVKSFKGEHDVTIGSTFAISTISGLIVFFSVGALAWLSKRSGKLEPVKVEDNNQNSKIKFKEIFSYPLKYWLITIIFVSLQTTVLAFVTCSQELLMSKYQVSVSQANKLGSVFNLVLSISSPIAGIIVDEVGKNILIIIISLILAVTSQLMIAFIICNPYLPLVVFGISCGTLFSCVLPLTPLVISPSQLGAAFGLSVSLSDLSLTIFNILAGYLLYRFGYLATTIFYASLLSCGLLSSIILWICDRKDGGNLNNTTADKIKNIDNP